MRIYIYILEFFFSFLSAFKIYFSFLFFLLSKTKHRKKFFGFFVLNQGKPNENLGLRLRLNFIYNPKLFRIQQTCHLLAQPLPFSSPLSRFQILFQLIHVITFYLFHIDKQFFKFG